MNVRFRAVLALGISVLTFGAGAPIQALADDGDVIALAKWGADQGGGGPPDLLGDWDLAVTGDSPGTGAGAGSALGHTVSGVQINDPSLDHTQFVTAAACTPTDPVWRCRPFEESVQSETSLAAFGSDIVVGYNSSANQPVVQAGPALTFTHRLLSGYSFSHDAGHSWQSGFIPPSAGSAFTFGDPALATDSAGNFFYASLGANAAGVFDITVSKSTDHGSTFAAAQIAALDNGADKEWIAVGPDPSQGLADSIYVTWTSFYAPGRTRLMMVKSGDGGATWSAQRILFQPNNPPGSTMSNAIQFSNPVVDASSGRLYIPFLHFSNVDQDFVKVLVSDDGGATFSFLNFNVPGAPETTGFPNVTPGIVADCGSPGGGFRLILHAGPNLGGGRFGLPRYRNATRLISQPSAAAAEGRLFIALNSSTSAFFGDPSAGSRIRLLYSPDGGTSWQVSTAVDATAADPQHVHPALSVDEGGQHVTIGYYVQQANSQLRVDQVSAKANPDGVSFGDAQNLQAAFDLIPSNNPIPTATQPFRTTNYDRTIVACYNIGEYMSTRYSGGRVLASWGGNPNSWTSPANSPAAGTHSQPDVFFTSSQRSQN